MNIEELETIKNLPNSFSSKQEKRDYFNLIIHEIYINKIKENPKLLTETKKEIEEWRLNKTVHNDIYRKWLKIINTIETNKMTQQILSKNEQMQQLRSISPFYFIKINNKLRHEILLIIRNIRVVPVKNNIEYLELI